MTRLRTWLAVAALLACAQTAHAQQPTAALHIPAPAKGRLSREQLQEVAKSIRALEANPLASDAPEARRALLMWVTDSPDVTVKVCSLVESLGDRTSAHHAELMLQFILSSSAYIIEHPDQAGDGARVSAGGLEGALATYAAYKALQGEQATNSALERLSTIRERGGLEQFVRESASDCS